MKIYVFIKRSVFLSSTLSVFCYFILLVFFFFLTFYMNLFWTNYQIISHQFFYFELFVKFDEREKYAYFIMMPKNAMTLSYWTLMTCGNIVVIITKTSKLKLHETNYFGLKHIIIFIELCNHTLIFCSMLF